MWLTIYNKSISSKQCAWYNNQSPVVLSSRNRVSLDIHVMCDNSRLYRCRSPAFPPTGGAISIGDVARRWCLPGRRGPRRFRKRWQSGLAATRQDRRRRGCSRRRSWWRRGVRLRNGSLDNRYCIHIFRLAAYVRIDLHFDNPSFRYSRSGRAIVKVNSVHRAVYRIYIYIYIWLFIREFTTEFHSQEEILFFFVCVLQRGIYYYTDVVYRSKIPTGKKETQFFSRTTSCELIALFVSDTSVNTHPNPSQSGSSTILLSSVTFAVVCANLVA